jgi:hypothetical protein
MYTIDNWRAFRTWGLSANSPWEHGRFWKLRDGVDRTRSELNVDWDTLQRPGFSPDYIDRTYARMDLAYETSDWIASSTAQALYRNNRPLLAFIGGKPARFTSKDHLFNPGETVEKQLIIINNARRSVTAEGQWAVNVQPVATGHAKETIEAGHQTRIPLRFELPATLAPGTYALNATVTFSTGETQSDRFEIQVVPRPIAPKQTERIALYDPPGDTRALLTGMGLSFQSVDAEVDLANFDVLIVGRCALTVDGQGLDLRQVRDGLRVVVFEQTANVLEQRLGFRVAEYGLRQVWPRVPDHPLLTGLNTESLRDWRGAANLLPSQLSYELDNPRYGPRVEWAGIKVTRLWRCGSRGNVASVLIEKPARGNFLPIVDGGFALEFSPLMEYREGSGMVLFCQMDVTGRSEEEPAVEILVNNILRYVETWKPATLRKAVYVGEAAGEDWLTSCGVVTGNLDEDHLSMDQVLIVGSGGADNLADKAAELRPWFNAGGHALVIGLDQEEVNPWLPSPIATKLSEHIAAYFEPAESGSLLAGVGPGEVHNRDPKQMPLVTGGATLLGDGVLAQARDANIVFCQLVPWEFQSDKQDNLKRTYRRVNFLLARLLANLGVSGSTPLLERFSEPVGDHLEVGRWLAGLYLDKPTEWDDPYRFFRW